MGKALLRHEGKAVEFVICFRYNVTHIHVEGKEVGSVTHAPYPQRVFDEVLRDAGVPLAKKPKE